jgi:hypothetical protein
MEPRGSFQLPIQTAKEQQSSVFLNVTEKNTIHEKWVITQRATFASASAALQPRGVMPSSLSPATGKRPESNLWRKCCVWLVGCSNSASAPVTLLPSLLSTGSFVPFFEK